MSVVLLVLGAATTLAGLLLVAAGVMTHTGSFDAEAITPGSIAVVGGLLLIGMGLAVRELRRIERTLAARSTLGSRPADTSHKEPGNASEASAGIAVLPKLQAPAPSPSAAPPERVRVKFPDLQGREEGPVVEEHVREGLYPAAASISAVGGTVGRSMPRPEPRMRPTVAPAAGRTSGVGAFPAGGRSRNDGAAASVHAVAVASAAEPMPQGEAEVERPANHPTAVTALKSGVVEGMAYTLYSDGSIEAQLPQGKLRFGSITALREHIGGGG